MKTLNPDRSTLLKELKLHFRVHKKEIRARLADFQSVTPSDYFYELVYCLLTPQSSAAHAEQAVSLLSSAGFHHKKVNPERILRRKECYIRFHRTKSRHLLRMKEQFPVIARKLSEPASAFELREWLVKNVHGLGYKESSHFLRNIGKNDGLAILDRHILRNLNRLDLIDSIPKTIGRKQYLEIEQSFSKCAMTFGIAFDELDLLFWSMETGEIRK
jgi:N-glycosylase/DNA lyase